ncbi:unnamed protein product [Phaeothamnion confervicola]
MANTAPVKWAQRKDSVYLTIALPDVQEEDLKLLEDKLIFKGKSNGQEYALELEFLHPVDPADSTWKVLPRNIQMHVIKKDKDADFWERLLKDKKLEKTNVSVDWDKYVDEDEEDGGESVIARRSDTLSFWFHLQILFAFSVPCMALKTGALEHDTMCFCCEKH